MPITLATLHIPPELPTPAISAIRSSEHATKSRPPTLISVSGVLAVPLAETSAVPLEDDDVGIAESLPLSAGDGVSHGGTAPPQHLCVGGCEVVVEQNRCGLVAFDQHPLVRQPGRGSVVEEQRHHRVVDEVEGNARDSVLEAAERSCRGCDSHAFDGKWYDVHAVSIPLPHSRTGFLVSGPPLSPPTIPLLRIDTQPGVPTIDRMV